MVETWTLVILLAVRAGSPLIWVTVPPAWAVVQAIKADLQHWTSSLEILCCITVTVL